VEETAMIRRPYIPPRMQPLDETNPRAVALRATLDEAQLERLAKAASRTQPPIP